MKRKIATGIGILSAVSAISFALTRNFTFEFFIRSIIFLFSKNVEISFDQVSGFFSISRGIHLSFKNLRAIKGSSKKPLTSSSPQDTTPIESAFDLTFDTVSFSFSNLESLLDLRRWILETSSYLDYLLQEKEHIIDHLQINQVRGSFEKFEKDETNENKSKPNIVFKNVDIRDVQISFSDWTAFAMRKRKQERLKELEREGESLAVPSERTSSISFPRFFIESFQSEQITSRNFWFDFFFKSDLIGKVNENPFEIKRSTKKSHGFWNLHLPVGETIRLYLKPPMNWIQTASSEIQAEIQEIEPSQIESKKKTSSSSSSTPTHRIQFNVTLRDIKAFVSLPKNDPLVDQVMRRMNKNTPEIYERMMIEQQQHDEAEGDSKSNGDVEEEEDVPLYWKLAGKQFSQYLNQYSSEKKAMSCSFEMETNEDDFKLKEFSRAFSIQLSKTFLILAGIEQKDKVKEKVKEIAQNLAERGKEKFFDLVFKKKQE